MKKLKLGLQEIEGVEVLTRAQLKMVMGGSGSSTKDCKTYTCSSAADCGTCGDRCSNVAGNNRCWWNPFG